MGADGALANATASAADSRAALAAVAAGEAEAFVELVLGDEGRQALEAAGLVLP
jgi:hypothetical protein